AFGGRTLAGIFQPSGDGSSEGCGALLLRVRGGGDANGAGRRRSALQAAERIGLYRPLQGAAEVPAPGRRINGGGVALRRGAVRRGGDKPAGGEVGGGAEKHRRARGGNAARRGGGGRGMRAGRVVEAQSRSGAAVGWGEERA